MGRLFTQVLLHCCVEDSVWQREASLGERDWAGLLYFALEVRNSGSPVLEGKKNKDMMP